MLIVQFGKERTLSSPPLVVVILSVFRVRVTFGRNGYTRPPPRGIDACRSKWR